MSPFSTARVFTREGRGSGKDDTKPTVRMLVVLGYFSEWHIHPTPVPSHL